MMNTKIAESLNRIIMMQFGLINSGPKFYPISRSFLAFLVNRKLRQSYLVKYWHKYIKVSLLRSPTYFKEMYTLQNIV